jgi:hypothetical protein
VLEMPQFQVMLPTVMHQIDNSYQMFSLDSITLRS